MAVAQTSDLRAYCVDVARRARTASVELAQVSTDRKNAWLKRAAAGLRERASEIAAANERDLAAAPGFGLTDAAIDRLRLTPKGIESIAKAMEDVAALADPA